MRSNKLNFFKKVVEIIDWNNKNWGPFKFLIAFFSFFTTLFAIILPVVEYVSEQNLDINWLLNFNIIIHFLIVLIFFFWRPRKSFEVEIELLKKSEDIQEYLILKEGINIQAQFNRAHESIVFFLNFWNALCITWIIYYSVEFINIFIISVFSPIYEKLFFNILNNIETIVILGCFLILSFPSYNLRRKKFKMNNSFFSFIVVILLISVYDVIIKYNQFNGFLTPDNFILHLTIPDFIGGVFSCIFLSLLAGRLDSKFLGVNTVFITIIYLYASLQAIFPIFNFLYIELKSNNELYAGFQFLQKPFDVFNLVTHYVALIGKVILFFIILIGIKDNSFFYYFLNIPGFTEKTQEGRKNIKKLSLSQSEELR